VPEEDPEDEDAFLEELADIVMEAAKEETVVEAMEDDYSGVEIPGGLSEVEPSAKMKLLEELQANVNNIPKFVPEGALTWKDAVTAEIHDGVIIKKTKRTWKMPAGETLVWEKLDERKVELEPGEEQIDDLDLEDIEREF